MTVPVNSIARRVDAAIPSRVNATMEDRLCSHGTGPRPRSPLLPASQLVDLMDRHRISDRALAGRLGLALARVAQARKDGIGCYSCACRWYAAITGIKVFRQRVLDWLNAEPSV